MERIVSYLRIIASISLIAGIGVLSPTAYFWIQNKVAAQSAASVVVDSVAPLPPKKPEVVYGHPIALSIPSLSLDLDIVDGTYDQATHAWTLTNDKVQYAVPTVLPNNDNGNTLIYGHNRKGVFMTLPTITAGAEATVTTDNGYRFIYAFDTAETIKPTDVNIFAYEGPARLTLQTCTGSFYQNRTMHYFHFVRYEKV